MASFSSFRRAWKRHYPDVITPKVKRFSHCEQCAKGKALREEYREVCTKSMTPEERKDHRLKFREQCRRVKAEQVVHLERVRTERRELNDAVHKSRCTGDSTKYFFFEIDSMDSAKTLLPHWTRIPKNVMADKLLKLHLTCVKYDGYRKDELFWYTNVTPHDSSTTATIIYQTILKVSEPAISTCRFLLDRRHGHDDDVLARRKSNGGGASSGTSEFSWTTRGERIKIATSAVCASGWLRPVCAISSKFASSRLVTHTSASISCSVA